MANASLPNLRTCTKCHLALPCDQFYKHKGRADGLAASCKSCWNQARREYNTKHPGGKSKWMAEYDRRYPEKAKERRCKYREKNKAKIAAARREHKRLHPEKHRAWQMVHRAIYYGRLVRADSCAFCGATDCPIEASHHDYSKPLEVTWLCRPCHRKLDDNGGKAAATKRKQKERLKEKA